MQKTSNRKENTEEGFSLVFDAPAYTLIFDGDKPPLPNERLQVVTIDSIEEAIRFRKLLGSTCELYISPEYRCAHPDTDFEAGAICVSELSKEAPFDTETAAALMRKLPLDLKSLLKSPLALREGQTMPPLIEKSLVHKISDTNVLISEPFSTGWLHYFNMFQDTAELTFDHPSEHVQGLLISEALRQAGIACAHIQGLPPEGKLVLLNYSTNFFNFIECREPIILRAYSSFSADETSEDKNALFFIQVIQWGRVCADSAITTFACLNIQRQKQLNERLIKIESRTKAHFESKVNRILETESPS
jgi:hypothetical protein